jgi:hypothetical protein
MLWIILPRKNFNAAAAEWLALALDCYARNECEMVTLDAQADVYVKAFKPETHHTLLYLLEENNIPHDVKMFNR